MWLVCVWGGGGCSSWPGWAWTQGYGSLTAAPALLAAFDVGDGGPEPAVQHWVFTPHWGVHTMPGFHTVPEMSPGGVGVDGHCRKLSTQTP